ncbi:MAG TPA: hypothetical protein VN644_19565 [Pyrinomonadaceae bacterium]|jgi:hypothetical protein|nr:hypothetical protein [Pyrinomonadaceae bacterium]
MRTSSERGSANLKFLVVMALLVAIAYSGYLYVPVAYNAKAYTDLMQHYADLAAGTGQSAAWITEQLAKNGPEYDVPPDAVITCALKDSRMEIHVQFVREIEFPGYTYNYEFDRTVKSTAFLSFK